MQENLNIQEILQWYIEAGVDATCPNDFHPLIEQQKEVQKPVLRPATTDLAQDFILSKQNAREICAHAQNLESLKEMLEDD